MRNISTLLALGCASLVTAGPCPFHNLQAAAAAGKLSAREAAIVDKMARDPAYIPALDPEATALMKRAAAPAPEANAAPQPGLDSNGKSKRQSLPVVGGGLCESSLLSEAYGMCTDIPFLQWAGYSSHSPDSLVPSMSLPLKSLDFVKFQGMMPLARHINFKPLDRPMSVVVVQH